MDDNTKGYDILLPMNNFDLSYDDLGEGSIPIIFLHGFPFNKNMWKPQVDLLKSFYRLIPYDIRGFGNSSDETSPLSIDLFANDLIQMMDKLEIQKAIICGLSMGGFIALNAILRFPERFEALILCDTQCIDDTNEIKDTRYTTIEDIMTLGTKKFNNGFIEKVFHKDSPINKGELVEQLRKVVFANSDHIIIQGLTALAERDDTCAKLYDITVPTLIICGKDDVVTPLAESELMHDIIKGSTLRVIDHAGHVSNLEQPYRFNHYLFDFLKTLGELNLHKNNGHERLV